MSSTSLNFITIDMQIPAMVPDNATITGNTRESYFDLYVEVDAVSSDFYSNFDCFTQTSVAVTDTLTVMTDQIVVFMDDGLKITQTLNTADDRLC